jgi:hypothetical protein
MNMTEKNKTHLSLLLAVLIVAAGWSACCRLYKPGRLASSPAIPTQAAWDAALATSTNQTLFGSVVAVGAQSISVLVQQPNLGTTSVAVGSTTSVIKNTPLSPAEMAAAFKEFQKEQKASGGRPFTPPSSFTTTVLSLADLRVGDTILITLAPGSAKGAFVAGQIEVMPPSIPQAGAPAGMPVSAPTPPTQAP